jgi:hypothetical protein
MAADRPFNPTPIESGLQWIANRGPAVVLAVWSGVAKEKDAIK